MNRFFLAPMVVAFFLAGACHREAAAPSTETSSTTQSKALRSVRTEPVTMSTFQRTIEATGTVAFNQNRSTPVLAPISGPVARILVEVGQDVGRGAALAIVSSPDFASAISGLRKAEATARNARHIADLDEQLFKNDAISRRDLEQAQTDAAGAEADRDSAIQQLRSLGVDEKTIGDVRENRRVENLGGVIRAPIAGTVVEKLISPGQLLQAGTTPCFTVADLSTVWVIANVFDTDLAAVHVGDLAEVATGGGQTLAGKVDYIAALVDPNTRAVSVRLAVPNTGRLLKRDMYVRVTLHSHVPAAGILVPVSAVLHDDENLPFAFVARADGSFERRRLGLGLRLGDRQEVTSGLAPGDSIVVDGGLFLQNEEHE